MYYWVLVAPVAKIRTKCLSLNDELCMVKPTTVDLNPTELKYYPFMISLDEFNRSCNILFPKWFLPKKANVVNIVKIKVNI